MIMPATTRENDPWKSEVTVEGSSPTSPADGASGPVPSGSPGGPAPGSGRRASGFEPRGRWRDLPRTAEALKRGRLSYAKVRAITRVATPESEEKLLEFAWTASAARLEQRVRMWKQLSREGELTAEQVRHRNRALSVFVDGDGMYVVRGRLEPEVGAVLRRAL